MPDVEQPRDPRVGAHRKRKPTDTRKSAADALDDVLARKMDERLSPRDLELLERCWSRQDIETLPASTGAHTLLWLVHYKLLGTFIDKLDRVWVETTQLGRNLVRHIRRMAVRRGGTLDDSIQKGPRP